MADGRPPKVGGLREDGLTGSVKGGRPTRAASLAKAADGAGIVGAISKFLARTPPQKKAKVTADGRPPKVGGLREDGLTGSVKGGRPTRAASLAKAADGAGIVGAISKFLARAPPQKKAKVTADVEMTTFSSTTTSPAATSSS